MKQCTKCQKLKDESEFYKAQKRQGGLRPWCKKCEREYACKYYTRLKKYLRYEERHRVVEGVKEKRCCKCRKWKAESEFYKRQRYKDGLEERCKVCSDKAVRKSRERRLAVRN